MNNKVYLYDGTFINLLNLIGNLVKEKIKPLDIKNEFTYMPNLIDEIFKKEIIEDENFIDRLINDISYDAFKIIYYVFLSEEQYKELIIYYFILNGFKYGKKIIYLRNLKCVREALRISKYVSYEAHRLKGFVRFKEYQNSFLYAEIEPTNDVLILLSNHFSKRLKNEFWIIKDKKRNIASVYQKNKYYLVDSRKININKCEISNNEENFEELWKTFFKTVAIKERTNPRCQMNFMPKKYWKHILEMEDKI